MVDYVFVEECVVECEFVEFVDEVVVVLVFD